MAAKEQVQHMSMQIGEVAKRASLTVDAIRFYERRRLLPNPSRTAGRFRLYTEDAVERLQFIQQMQGLGFSLKEVGELLKLRKRKVEPCESLKKLLDPKLADVRSKLADVRSCAPLQKSQNAWRQYRRTPPVPPLLLFDLAMAVEELLDGSKWRFVQFSDAFEEAKMYPKFPV